MRVATKEWVLTTIEEHGAELSAFGVRRLGLFGSYVRGEASPDSDIDVLVDFEENSKTFDNFMKVALLLEDLLGRRVDLVTREALSPYIAPNVISEIEYASVSGSVPTSHPR
jgi:predicted nucleotidyltransferase